MLASHAYTAELSLSMSVMEEIKGEYRQRPRTSGRVQSDHDQTELGCVRRWGRGRERRAAAKSGSLGQETGQESR